MVDLKPAPSIQREVRFYASPRQIHFVQYRGTVLSQQEGSRITGLCWYPAVVCPPCGLCFVVRPLHIVCRADEFFMSRSEELVAGGGSYRAGPLQIDPRAQRKVCGVRGWAARQLIFGCTDGALNRR